MLGAFSLGFLVKLPLISALLAVFTLMLADFFDTMGTAFALGAEGEFLDDSGQLPGMKRVLLVDSLAAVAGGAASASSATTYIESASGIAEGGRTGLTSVVTGGLFLVALFLSPLAAIIPPEATAPALILVGFVSYPLIKYATGRGRDVHWMLAASSVAFFVYFALDPIRRLVGIG